MSKGGFSFVQSALSESRNVVFVLKIATCGISLIIACAAWHVVSFFLAVLLIR